VNQTVLSKNWTFYDSEKGSTDNYNIITWSYKKEYYSDKAQGWLNLYTYEGFPNKISYTVHNKESYSLIYNSLSATGYKLVNSEIEDNEIISTYSSNNYTLEISTLKNKIDEWEDRSLTAYRITLIKKAGIYDPENGKKADYYDDGKVKIEYSLINGKLNGTFKVYYENGELKKIGNYINGLENGLFKEYDELGNLEAEVLMTNGMKNGVLKVYENGKISVSTTYKNDMKSGQYVEYFYNDETGKLQLKNVGNYLNDEKNGILKLFFIEENNTERLLKFENYTKDLKNGVFQDIKGDSLIVGNYRNDLLNGKYKIYLDISRMFLGGVIRTDTSELVLISEGNYYEDAETGYWKYYDFAKTLREEGRFENGEKIGEWKHYYTSWVDDKGNSLPYSKQLFLVQNYANGVLDGKSTRYSYLNEEEYPCTETDENKNPLDTCIRYVYQKVLETSFYKNGKLNGPFEVRDSSNNIIAKGNFKNDNKDGEWIHCFVDKNENNEIISTYQVGLYSNDQRNGKWIQYIDKENIERTINYKNGKFDGEVILWNKYNRPEEKRIFNQGQFKELIINDSIGINPIRKYEIIDLKKTGYTCRRTNYFSDGYSTQVYYIELEDELNPEWFELTFSIKTSEKIGNGKSYKNGDYYLYNNNNLAIITGKYCENKKCGFWIFEYPESDTYSIKLFKEDILTEEKFYNTKNKKLYSGIIKFDFKDGQEVVKTKKGLRNGKTTYFDKDGKFVSERIYKDGFLVEE